jgi:hypothetical protein
MVNASFQCASAYGFEMVDAAFAGQMTRVPVNRKFTPYEMIQILRKFSRPKILKIYPPVV